MCPRRSKIDFIAKVSTLLLPIVGISLLIRETDMLFLWLERLNHWVLTVKKNTYINRSISSKTLVNLEKGFSVYSICFVSKCEIGTVI